MDGKFCVIPRIDGKKFWMELKEMNQCGYDYIIGSMHYFKINREYVRVYYETPSQLTDCEGVDTVGHLPCH